VGVFAGPEIVEDGLVLALDAANLKSYDSRIISGQQTYTSSGTHSWTCPSGVTSVSVVCIGGGGGGNGGGNGVGGAGGGGGGGLGYKNNISVTPGQSYTVVVGGGGAGDYWSGPPYSTDPADSGGDSYFIDATTVKGGGGGGGNGNSGAAGGSGGTYVGDGGGNGNSGGTGSGSGSGTGYLPATGGGGGSTGTYTGNATTRGTSKYITSNCISGCLAGNGTGQGLLGTGSSGLYGRGGGANMNTFSNGTSGYTGAVRIMWGPDRSYPSTGVADQSGSTAFDDISGQGNNGTFGAGSAAPTYDSANGGSLVFDGSDDYVTIPTITLDKDNSAFSVWFTVGVDFTGNYGNRGIILGYNGDEFLSLFAISAQNNLQGETNTNEDYYLGAFGTGDTSISNGWNNVQVSFENSIAKTYINGILKYTSTTLTNDLAINEIVSSDATANYQGNIAQVSIYNKSLTASEVKQNFNALRRRFGI